MRTRGVSKSLTYSGIPMPGGTESLNIATASAIILYEGVRQRGFGDMSRKSL